MKVEFWGVRGSLPTPLSPDQLLSKICAVVQRITPADLESSDSRERFVNSLPASLKSTIGGNTACVEMLNKNNTLFIMDAGSGIRSLGKKYGSVKNLVCHIFISHFHWDHIQGLPFFDPIYNPSTEIHFYSCHPDCEKLLRDQMEYCYFPVPLSSCTKNMHFHIVKEGEPFVVDGVTVNTKKMFHPSDSYSYSFEEDGKKFVYATDLEIQPGDSNDGTQTSVFSDADVLVLDSQYTVEEGFIKESWGHSTFNKGIDFGLSWGVKNIYLFHHDPTYDDKKIHSILESAKWYLDYGGNKSLNVHIASEGTSITL